MNRTDARDVARSIAYAADVLAHESNALVWVFPQAAILPADARPVVIRPGASHIAQHAAMRGPVGILPVAWHLVFRGEQHPEAFVRVGAVERFDAPRAHDVSAVAECMGYLLTREMDALRGDLRANSLSEYRTILRGAAGVNDRFDRLLRRDRLVPDQ